MNSCAVAELVWALILSVDRMVPNCVAELRDSKWNKGAYTNCKGIKGRTLGIIGYGAIGRLVAARALAFEMNVVAFDAFVKKSNNDNVKLVGSVDEVLKVADILTVHVPGSGNTK